MFNYEIEKWDSNCEMGFYDVPNFEAESLENSGFEKNGRMFRLVGNSKPPVSPCGIWHSGTRE